MTPRSGSPLRVGIVGLGANTRLRHVPGLRSCDDVAITAVCNRRPESTRSAAAEFGIPKCFDHWEQLVSCDEVDAVVIGAWPNLHCAVTLAALAAGKHVLTEARMARNAVEARQMLDAAEAQPQLVTQIVPSPLGFRCGVVLREMLDAGFLGELRELVVLGAGDLFADPTTPRHWRQTRALSGNNTLALGILHETLTRWVEDPVAVQASGQIFTRRRDTGDGPAEVDVPDTLHVLTELPSGARGLYHLSSVAHFGPGHAIHLYGSRGVVRYDFNTDRLWAAQAGDDQLHEVDIPAEKAGVWRVEQDFVDAIRGGPPITLTDFATGLRYMKFTDAVVRSLEAGRREAVT